MPAGPDSYGKTWYLEAAARANTAFPASSVYVDDLTVYAFHKKQDGQALVYDVSVDGGQTFPTVNATAVTVGSPDIIAARLITLASGVVRVLLLQNDAVSIRYSDNVFTLPTSSTWTSVTPPGSVSAPVGIEVNGLNVVVACQDGGGNLKMVYSTDGGTTFTAASTGIADTVVTAVGYNLFAAVSSGIWCFINSKSGSIYRSVNGGVTWGALVKTIAAGNAGLQDCAAIFAPTATRVVAVYKGQVSVSDDAGLTWTDKQNLTLVANSPVAIQQGGISHLASFGLVSGVPVLGGATNYALAFTSVTTRGAMWLSTDLGTTWTIVNAVGGGGFAFASSMTTTGFAARAGRAVLDLREVGGPTRKMWYNPNPPPVPAPPAVMGPQLVGACSAFTVCPCPSTCD